MILAIYWQRERCIRIHSLVSRLPFIQLKTAAEAPRVLWLIVLNVRRIMQFLQLQAILQYSRKARKDEPTLVVACMTFLQLRLTRIMTGTGGLAR